MRRHHTRRTRAAATFVCTFVLVVALGACTTGDGGDDPGDDPSTGDDAAEALDDQATDLDADSADDETVEPPPSGPVVIQDRAFGPPDITVTIGSTVTWTNEDEIPHTVTSGDPDDPDGMFDASLDEQGVQASVTFDATGEFSYHCTLHPDMVGTITVWE